MHTCLSRSVLFRYIYLSWKSKTFVGNTWKTIPHNWHYFQNIKTKSEVIVWWQSSICIFWWKPIGSNFKTACDDFHARSFLTKIGRTWRHSNAINGRLIRISENSSGQDVQNWWRKKCTKFGRDIGLLSYRKTSVGDVPHHRLRSNDRKT